jgi:hypothetical protein
VSLQDITPKAQINVTANQQIVHPVRPIRLRTKFRRLPDHVPPVQRAERQLSSHRGQLESGVDLLTDVIQPATTCRYVDVSEPVLATPCLHRKNVPLHGRQSNCRGYDANPLHFRGKEAFDVPDSPKPQYFIVHRDSTDAAGSPNEGHDQDNQAEPNPPT